MPWGVPELLPMLSRGSMLPLMTWDWSMGGCPDDVGGRCFVVRQTVSSAPICSSAPLPTLRPDQIFGRWATPILPPRRVTMAIWNH